MTVFPSVEDIWHQILGVVELTMALHLSLDLPDDKIVWDVGHQAYTHKILTGRKDEFNKLRKYGGISGFPKRRESDCDPFGTGHSPHPFPQHWESPVDLR